MTVMEAAGARVRVRIEDYPDGERRISGTKPERWYPIAGIAQIVPVRRAPTSESSDPASDASVRILDPTPLEDRAFSEIMATLCRQQETGRVKYAQPFHACDGRDPLRDVLEESVDAAQYAVKAMEERRMDRLENARLADRVAELEAEVARLRGVEA